MMHQRPSLLHIADPPNDCWNYFVARVALREIKSRSVISHLKILVEKPVDEDKRDIHVENSS